MRIRKTISLSCLLIILWAGVAWSAPSLTVRVNPETVQLGESVQLNVQAVTDSRTGGGELNTPNLSDWRIVGQMRRASYTRQQRVTILDLTLQPTRTGTLTIGAFSMSIRGKVYRSQPVTVTVSSSAQDTIAEEMTNEEAPENGEEAPDELVFLRWEIEKQSVWLGEPLEASLYIFFRDGLRVDKFNHGKMDITGFWREQADTTDRPERVQVGSQLFIRDEIARYRLYPLKAGTLELPALEATMAVRKNTLFTRGRASDLSRSADAIPVEVRALPEANRPAGYRGLVVGPTRVVARLDRSRIRANDGVELMIDTEIDGLAQNLPEITLPELPNFRVFPSATTTSVRRRDNREINVRRQSWLLRPTKGGQLRVPSVELPYFDPKLGKYAVARSSDLVVNVSGKPSPVNAEPPVKAAGETSIKLHSIRTDDSGDSAPNDGNLPLWFLVSILAAPLLLIGDILGARVRASRAASAGTRAARGAAKQARAELANIGATSDIERGYESIHSILLRYLEERFEQTFNGKTYAQTEEAIAERGVRKARAGRTVELLEALDFARFARSGDREDLVRTVDQALTVIGDIEDDLA